MDKAKIESLIKDLASDNFSKTFDAGNKLVEFGEEAIPMLIDALQVDNQRVGASQTLGRIGKSAVVPLINCLYDPNSRVRLMAAIALGRTYSKNAVEPLIELLNDPVSDVRMYAAEALGDIGDARALQPLKDRMRSEDSMLAIQGISNALKKLQ